MEYNTFIRILEHLITKCISCAIILLIYFRFYSPFCGYWFCTFIVLKGCGQQPDESTRTHAVGNEIISTQEFNMKRYIFRCVGNDYEDELSSRYKTCKYKTYGHRGANDARKQKLRRTKED